MPARDWALIRNNYNQTYNLKVETYFQNSKDTSTKELYLIKGTDSIPIAQMRIKLFDNLQPQELNEVTVRVFDSCNLLEPVFKYRTIRCIPGTESATILQYESLADILGNQCHKECYAAVPEMWQVRIEANRPQMVFMFAEIVDEAISINAKTVWTQLGIWHQLSAQKAIDAGLNVVMDACIKIEYLRLRVGSTRDI